MSEPKYKLKELLPSLVLQARSISDAEAKRRLVFKGCCGISKGCQETDNDTAFTDKFSSRLNRATGLHAMDVWCEINGIEHKLIPIGQKELNGKVENTHKQDDRELFSQIRPLTLEALKMHARRYNEHWNERRKTKALSWQTPEQIVSAAPARAYVFLKLFINRYAPNDTSLVKLDAGGNAFLQTNEKPYLPSKKPKRLSAVNRYLQYLDWDAKRKLKSLVAPVAMSQTFSKNIKISKVRLTKSFYKGYSKLSKTLCSSQKYESYPHLKPDYK